MPIYEYSCLDCGARFDILRTIKEADAPIPCKKCESMHTKRSISVFFAQSSGQSLAGTGGSCAGCQGGSCSTCGH